MSGVDQIFWFASFAGEVVLVIILFARREFRRFPIFLASLIVQAVSDPIVYWISQHRSDLAYEQAYTIATIVDYLLQFGVLAEIGHAVLRPGKQSMSRKTLTALFILLVFCFIAAMIWTPSQKNTHFVAIFAKLEQINLVFAFLRLTVFALVAGFSQMLGITWRNHVIRLAAGLAFYSAVGLVVQLTISHLSQANHGIYSENYYLLNRTQVISYLLALAFWVWSFVQKDAPRREFTPQMERLLVTISQTARRSRVGFARSLGHK